MDSAELLEQLADIHLPVAVSFWPPAPGWWILALLVGAGVVWSYQYIGRLIRQRRICAYAIQELDNIRQQYEDSDKATEEAENEANLLFINQFNAVIRRVALWHYPNRGIASLGGTGWVDFIKEKGDSSGLTDDISQAISHGRFMPHCDVDVYQLYQFGQQWISSLYLNPVKSEESRETLKLSA